jgi:hypothetical protein
MATIHVWEIDGEVRCKASLKGKKFQNAQQVKFEFLLQPGTAVTDTVDAKVKSGVFREKTAEAVWKPAAVPHDHASQKYRYRVVVDGVAEANLPDEVVVWGRSIEVTAKLADGNPAAGALVKFSMVDPPPAKGEGRGAARERVLRADDQGKINFRLPYASDVNTAVQRPWALDDAWVVGTGQRREVTVKRGFNAEIEWPVADATLQLHRQWVNLPVDLAKPEQGQTVKVKVKPVTTADAEAGDTVYVKVTYDGNNSGRKVRGGEQPAGKVLTFERTLSMQKTCTFDVELSPAGGDKVTVEVGGTPAASDATVDIQSWRKLFYALASPDFMDADLGDDTLPDGNAARGLPDAVRNQLKAVLDPVFIEYALVSSGSSGAYPARQIHAATYLGKTGRLRLVQTTKDYATDTPVAFGAGDVRTVKVKLCDAAYKEATCEVTAAPVVNAQPFFYPFYQTHKKDLFLKDLNTGSDAILVAGCTWEADVTGLTYDPDAPHPAFDDEGHARTGPVDVAWFRPNNTSWVEIRFPNGSTPKELVAPTTAFAPVTVKVTFKAKVPMGSVNGCALSTRQLLVMKADAPMCMAATFCHELGHTMGMTITPKHNQPPYGLPAPPTVDSGGVYYRNPLLKGDKAGKKGVRPCHQGPHCADALDVALETFAGLEGTCVMFGEGGSDDLKARTAYCATCTKNLKARNVADIKTDFIRRPAADC